MDSLQVFINRLKNIGVDVELTGSYPWVYIYKINGIIVTERYLGRHGFTLAFLPIRIGEELKFTSIREIFSLIRKYI